MLAAIAVVIVGYQHNEEAPFPGSATVAQYALENLGPDDVLILGNTSVFSFATNTETPVALEDTPTKQIGFAPDYLDPRIRAFGSWAAKPTRRADIRAWTTDTDRVLVLGDGVSAAPSLEAVESVLSSEGFTRQVDKRFDWSRVEVWTR